MRKRPGCLLLADVVILTSLTGTNAYAVYAESEKQVGSEGTEIPELAGKNEAVASEEKESEQNVREAATSEEEESERNVERHCVVDIINHLNEYYPRRSDGSTFPVAEKDSVTGTTLGQFNLLADALKEVYTKWDERVGYNKKNKNDPGEKVEKTDLALSYVIIAMAIHSATDTYAHRAGIKKDGEWVAVKTNDEDHDKLELGGARAKAAQITCNRTLKRFHGNEKDCVAPFLIENLDGYGGNGVGAFRLRNYQKCADEITDKYKNKLGRYSYTK